MKTLAEVIKNLGDGTEHLSAILVSKETWGDALSYLNEYKELSKMWNDRLDKENSNSPLTWDELKTMEGKPVWIEYGCDFNQKRWVIIHSFHNTKSFCYMDVSGNYPNTFWQKDMGEDEFWQAYRKERE